MWIFAKHIEAKIKHQEKTETQTSERSLLCCVLISCFKQQDVIVNVCECKRSQSAMRQQNTGDCLLYFNARCILLLGPGDDGVARSATQFRRWAVRLRNSDSIIPEVKLKPHVTGT
jgi:hypothetical protein